MKLVDTKDAVGTVLCHDITQIIKGVTKDARFRKGHVVKISQCCYPLEKIIYTSGKPETICFMKMMQQGSFVICARMKE